MAEIDERAVYHAWLRLATKVVEGLEDESELESWRQWAREKQRRQRGSTRKIGDMEPLLLPGEFTNNRRR